MFLGFEYLRDVSLHHSPDWRNSPVWAVWKVSIVDIGKQEVSFNCLSIVQLFGVAIMAKREAFIIEKAVKLMKLQLKVQNLSLSSHSPKPSTGLDWSLCWANPGFRALCLTPLLYNIIWCTWICVWTADGG